MLTIQQYFNELKLRVLAIASVHASALAVISGLRDKLDEVTRQNIQLQADLNEALARLQEQANNTLDVSEVQNLLEQLNNNNAGAVELHTELGHASDGLASAVATVPDPSASGDATTAPAPAVEGQVAYTITQNTNTTDGVIAPAVEAPAADTATQVDNGAAVSAVDVTGITGI